MPTTAAPDMTHVWAGRTRKARERRLVAAMAEAFMNGWTVDTQGLIRDDLGVVKARIHTY
jgi:hypothetical protein